MSKVYLKIDYRERDLIDEIKRQEDNKKQEDNKRQEEKDNQNVVQIITENLPIGDIIVVDNLGNELLVIERKTIKDLAASIRDGRYNEQSYRLNGLPIHNHNIVYLIEGEMNTNLKLPFKANKNMVDKNTIYSALFSIMYYKGFSVIRSDNIVESAIILCNMVRKIMNTTDKTVYYTNTNTINVCKAHSTKSNGSTHIENVERCKKNKEQEVTNGPTKKEGIEGNLGSPEKEGIEGNLGSPKKDITNGPTKKEGLEGNLGSPNDKEEGSEGNLGSPDIKSYSSVVKKVKKENITRDNINVIMLCQIPNVSWQVAEAVLKEHGTVVGLIEQLRKDGCILNNIKTQINGGKERKISKTAIKYIMEYLL